MLIRKCDICGSEIGMYETRHIIISKPLEKEIEHDICSDCMSRIINEITESAKKGDK